MAGGRRGVPHRSRPVRRRPHNQGMRTGSGRVVQPRYHDLDAIVAADADRRGDEQALALGADFGRAQATRLVRGLGSQVGDHDRIAAPRGGREGPRGASTLMVAVFSATPPVAEVVKTIV